jgi:hypothetical protein
MDVTLRSIYVNSQKNISNISVKLIIRNYSFNEYNIECITCQAVDKSIIPIFYSRSYYIFCVIFNIDTHFTQIIL